MMLLGRRADCVLRASFRAARKLMVLGVREHLVASPPSPGVAAKSMLSERRETRSCFMFKFQGQQFDMNLFDSPVHFLHSAGSTLTCV